jgi:hypothetical protein
MADSSERSGLGLMIVVTWFCLAALLILKAATAPGGLVLSTDDAMRLVQVRDLLDGQAWFDTTQWRMNAPFGLPMHWSRLVDGGIAGLILLFRFVTDAKTAETWALYVWPLLPLLPVLFALTHVAFRLAGRTGALLALALGASCVAAMTPFKPGNIDHHNVQLALGLAYIAFLIDFDRSRWAAIFAAITAAVSLAIGIETIPYVAAGVFALAVWWIADGRISGAVARFGVTLAVASALLLMGATAIPYRFSAACDTFSGYYAAMLIASGAGMAALSKLAVLNTPLRKSLAVIGAGTALIVMTALLAPACLHGPYSAVDPRLYPIWMSGVAEDQSPFTLGRMAPGDFIGGYFYCLLAALASVAAVFLVERDKRQTMAIVCGFALAGLAIASLEMRGLAFALLFATPGLIVIVTKVLGQLALPKTASAIATFGAVLLASNASYAFVGAQIQKSLPVKQQFDAAQTNWMQACNAPKAFRELGALPAGRVVGFIDQGPMILAYTHHATLAGPYHRNSAGILDTYSVFAGSAVEQRAVLKSRRVDYVLLCTPAPDYTDWGAGARPDSLLKRDAKGLGEPWLEAVVSKPKGGAIRIYRVRQDHLD